MILSVRSTSRLLASSLSIYVGATPRAKLRFKCCEAPVGIWQVLIRLVCAQSRVQNEVLNATNGAVRRL